jgi:hypothetical protein
LGLFSLQAVHSVVISLDPDYTIKGREANLFFVIEDVSYASTLLSFMTDFVCFAALSSSYRLISIF